MFNPGDCILITSYIEEGGKTRYHLFVVILELEENTNNTIIVSVQSIRGKKYDKTTILTPGDHEFIKHPSFVRYGKARIVSNRELEQLIENGEGIRQTSLDVNGPVFRKICDGITKSDFTPIEVYEMYKDHIYNNL